MPANNDRFKEHELAALATDTRLKFLSLKDSVHQKDVRLQQKVRSRKEWISDAKVFTRMKDMAIRGLKAAHKKKATSESNGEPAPMRVVQVDSHLAKFLGLERRGFKPIIDGSGNKVWYYCDTLTLSYFSNWVVATGRQDGRNVKLEDDDPFVRLFGEDMKKPGTGPTHDTAILDTEGKQVNPFVNNKHMTLFSSHYPRKGRRVGNDSKITRVVFPKEDYPDAYACMVKERELLTGDMKKARNEYKNALKRYNELLAKKDQASRLGDNTLRDHLEEASDQVNIKKRAYMRLMNENDFKHKLAASTN